MWGWVIRPFANRIVVHEDRITRASAVVPSGRPRTAAPTGSERLV
jgi:hypothetical protein